MGKKVKNASNNTIKADIDNLFKNKKKDIKKIESDKKTEQIQKDGPIKIESIKPKKKK